MNQVLSDEELQMQVVRVGIEAEAFMSTDFGKYLIDRAELHKAQHMQALYEAPPDDTRTNILTRIEISAADKFLEWLREAINSGRTAHMQIREGEALE